MKRMYIQSANQVLAADGPTVVASSTKSGYGTLIALSANPNAGWMPGSFSGIQTFTIDLKAAFKLYGWALLNHTVYSSGAGVVSLQYGTADNGTTFDQTADSISTSGHPEYEPHVMGFVDSVPAKRYWRLAFYGCTSLWFVGGIYLGAGWNTITEVPDDMRDVPDDTAAQSETSTGHGRRHAFGNTVTLTNMIWKRTTATIRADFKGFQARQEGRGDPILFRDHNWTYTGVNDPFPCRLVTIEKLHITEVRPGDRWRIQLAVKDAMLT